jgi:hypothetical protein
MHAYNLTHLTKTRQINYVPYEVTLYFLLNFVKEVRRCKIVKNKRIVKQTVQIKAFSYLSFCISYQNEKDISVKVSKFLQVKGMFNRHFKLSQVQKHSRRKALNTLTLPDLLYGYEIGAIRE